MKAVYITTQGGPEALQFGDLPEPKPGTDEVRVRVRAAALNRLDTYTRGGIRGMKRATTAPLILGGDAAGDVVAVGAGVHDLTVGMRVVIDPRLSCGACVYCTAGDDDMCDNGGVLGSNRDGSYAEYVVVPAGNAFPMAANVAYEAAAAAPTTYLPVWNILIRKARLQAWETVLVTSASAGVGSAAIDVAKHVVGARVIATTSTTSSAPSARALGADEVVLYTSEDVAKRVKELTNGQGVDVAIDHTGEQAFEAVVSSLKKGGRFGICGVTSGYKGQLQLGTLFTRHLHVFGVYVSNREDMRQLVAALDRGAVSPAIERVFTLAEARQAHELMESRNFFGKILLRP